MKRLIRTASTYVLDHNPLCHCKNHATTFMVLHRAGDCLQEQTVSYFRCDKCLAGDLAKVDQICADGGAICSTCGLEVVTLSDLVVRLTKL